MYQILDTRNQTSGHIDTQIRTVGRSPYPDARGGGTNAKVHGLITERPRRRSGDYPVLRTGWQYTSLLITAEIPDRGCQHRSGAGII